MPPPLDNGSDSDPGETPATPSLKRGHAQLLDALTVTGRKKAKIKDAPLEPYLNAARWIPRAINPFTNVNMVFAVGLQDGCFDDEERFDLTPAERTRYLSEFKQILALIPNFSETLNMFADDVAALLKLVNAMSEAAGGARSDDCGGLKHIGLTYVCLNPETDVILPPIVKSLSKSDRGLNHKTLGGLMCPRSMLRAYHEDPSFVCKLQDGRIKMVADDWCTFLYEDGVYDEDELDKGLLRGYFLLRVYCHIFTGPSSALKLTSKAHASRAGNAKLHGLTHVTPTTIAYAAVQARFLISTMDAWSTEDGHFKITEFYENIIQLFDDMDDPWVINTLAWQVFGIRHGAEPCITDTPTDTGSRLARTLAQRAARSRAFNASSGETTAS